MGPMDANRGHETGGHAACVFLHWKRQFQPRKQRKTRKRSGVGKTGGAGDLAVPNGMLVHLEEEIRGETGHKALPAYRRQVSQGPLVLSGHGCPVRFRNIWVRRLEAGSRLVEKVTPKD